MRRPWRAVCEHGFMLFVCFFLLWNLFYMTEAQWTFSVRGAFPALSWALMAAALAMCRFRPGTAGLMMALPAWMLLASAYRGPEVLSAQLEPISRAALAFGAVLMAPRVVRWERLCRWLKAALALWTAAITLQAAIGLWAALTGHAVFSLRGTWYIGVNLGDHRLYLNAYVTTGAAKTGLTVALTAVLAAMCRRRVSRVACAGCALVQLLCLSLTDCRTAFIAVGVVLGAALASGVLRAEKRRRGWRWVAAVAVVIAVTVTAYAGLSAAVTALSPCVPQELHNISLPEVIPHLLPHAAAEGAVQHRAIDAGNLFNDRQIIWKAALQLLSHEPKFLFTGTTTALAPSLTNAWISPENYPGYDFLHVHNIYLQTLVSWGIPGVALLAVFLWRFLRAAWRVMVRHSLPVWQRLTPVPVLYVMVCELVDCFTRLSEDSPLLLYACLFAGLTLAVDARARRKAFELASAAAPVDVIIPVYNAAAYLRRAAESALRCPQVRLILVDDGSTDGSAEICDELAAVWRVTVIHQENRGAAAARNAGLAAASAEFVAFLDADDELLPGALAALSRCIGAADAAQGEILRDDPGIYPTCRTRVLNGRQALSESLENPTRRLLCHGWVFRRSLLTERFDERLTLGEDGEWMLRTLQHAQRVVFAAVPAYRYTVRPDSALHGGTGAQQAYMATLAAAEPALQAADMPRPAALYRLSHLLLMLTHDPDARPEVLRDAEPFAGAFKWLRLPGLSPRLMAMWLLKMRIFAPVRWMVRIRRWMNRRAGKVAPEIHQGNDNS